MPTKKWRFCLHDVIHMVVSGSQKQFRYGLWCPWLRRRAFSCRFVRRAGLASRVPSLIRSANTDSDGASRLCRTRRQTHNKDFDFETLLTMIHEGLPVSVVSVDLFITGTETTTTGTVYEWASSPISTKSLHQVIECVSVTHAQTRTYTWSNATVVTVFSSSSFAEFSIKVCLLWKFKSHQV